MFREQSKVIDAIETGADAATKGRPADNISAFEALNPNQKNTFRIGYADKLLGKIEKTAGPGTNRARPFTSIAKGQELPAFARPGQAQPLTRGLERENTMFETFKQALGNSKTSENLADDMALGVDPSVMGNLMLGRVMAAGQNALGRAATNISGNTPAVREELAKILLSQNDPNINRMISRILAGQRVSDRVKARLVSGLLGGAGTGVSPYRK